MVIKEDFVDLDTPLGVMLTHRYRPPEPDMLPMVPGPDKRCPPRGTGRGAAFLLAILAAGAGCKKKEPIQAPIFSIGSLRPSRPYKFPAARRVVAIGDLHGDLAAGKRALVLAGAIDPQGGWIGKDLVVVQTGDQLDRGDDDRDILDFFEGLAHEAQVAGGALHVLNGNHELLNVQGDFRYVTSRGFAAFADSGSGTEGRTHAFTPGGSYAKKLAEQNIVEIVGDTVFVHGGVLPEHVQVGVGPINEAVRQWMLGHLHRLPALVAGETAPIWTRSLSHGTPSAEVCNEVAGVLAALQAKRMVVGHTVQDQGINSACDDQVWRIDVGLSRFYGERPAEVLEIVGANVRPLREPVAAPEAAPDRSAE